LLNGGFGYENLQFSIPVAVEPQGRGSDIAASSLHRLSVSVEGLRQYGRPAGDISSSTS
jgi:hypothetical protein